MHAALLILILYLKHYTVLPKRDPNLAQLLANTSDNIRTTPLHVVCGFPGTREALEWAVCPNAPNNLRIIDISPLNTSKWKPLKQCSDANLRVQTTITFESSIAAAAHKTRYHKHQWRICGRCNTF